MFGLSRHVYQTNTVIGCLDIPVSYQLTNDRMRVENLCLTHFYAGSLVALIYWQHQQIFSWVHPLKVHINIWIASNIASSRLILLLIKGKNVTSHKSHAGKKPLFSERLNQFLWQTFHARGAYLLVVSVWVWPWERWSAMEYNLIMPGIKLTDQIQHPYDGNLSTVTVLWDLGNGEC